MIISLGDSLRIIGAERDWRTQKRRIKNGREVWESFKFHSTLGSAMAEAGHREIRLSEGSSLTDLIDVYTRVTQRLERKLNDALDELAERANAKVAAATSETVSDDD